MSALDAMLGASIVTVLPPNIIARRDDKHGSLLGDVMRRLSSDSDGEIVATVRAVRRLLESEGVGVHELVDHIEGNGGGFDEAVAKQIYDAAYSRGYARGTQDAENKQHGARDFLRTDGKPEWDEVALFLQRNKHWLDSKHHQFVDDMCGRTVWGREPTEKQHRYLHSLFFQLGGKIT